MLYNISYLCTYFSSSVSHWERYSDGSLLDGSYSKDRFSVHTLDEHGAFVQVDLPNPCYVEKIDVVMRDIYLTNVIPLDVFIQTEDKHGWSLVKSISGSETLLVGQKISAVRILKNNKGSVVLSSINIYTNISNFRDWIEKCNESNTKNLVYVYAPFYGLGGRLSVIATALGFVSSQSTIKEIVLDAKTAKCLEYPREINLSKNNRHYEILLRNLASHFLEYILFGKNYISEKNIASYDSSESFRDKKQNVVIVSRDNLAHYQNKNESMIDVCRRLYEKIIPSCAVLDTLAKIESDFNLYDVYDKALAVHIRHGNGEKYYSSVRKLWGVKPPSSKKIFNAIQAALKDNEYIDTIILSSDCKAVFSYIKNLFPNYKVIFISRLIQEIGLGCNHNQSLFNKAFLKYRAEVDINYEDEIVFAEILALSRCKALCGGSSYFFDAVKYFSDCDIDKIYYLDNKDRYIKIDEAFKPLSEATDGIGYSLVNILQQENILIDGLFYCIRNTKITISYFDKILFKGDALSISEKDLKDIQDQLIDLRLY